MMDYQTYLYKTYSSWLGKIIGIRMGAPVEGWDHNKIVSTYDDFSHYLIDYHIFAADDDSNGPLFFSRALLNGQKLNAEMVGDVYLAYLQEHKGFFWWGGYGVATEHTAYDNLLKGIKPPLSGSIKTNGVMIAEQIGGQIFSDCWAYVNGSNTDRAVACSKMAASVSHDGNGLQGAVFVAAAISLAYKYDDIHLIIDRALTYLDKRMKYYKVAREVLDFYQNNSDPEACLRYIRENHGYDKYPGVCHIIPNMAIMIMAMAYGNNDFEKTMTLLNRAGWDTDCNLGNVGSIMGAMLGVDKIDKKWILPINDIVNASSCIGCLNIQTVSSSAKYFAKLAFKLEGIDINDDRHFDLPFATDGFFNSELINNTLFVKKDSEIYRYTYYQGKDLYDARYDPSFSPLIYPGDELIFDLKGDGLVFVEDCDGQRYYGDNHKITIPKMINGIINKIGYMAFCDTCIDDYQIIHHPCVDYDFTTLPYDVYGPCYDGSKLYNIRAFVEHSGHHELIKEGLHLKSDGHSLISTGHLDDIHSGLELNFSISDGGGLYLVFNMKDAQHYWAFGLEDNLAILLKKDIEFEYIDKRPYIWKKDGNIKLNMFKRDDRINLLIDGLLVFSNCEIGDLHSLVGIMSDRKVEALVTDLKLL